MEPIIQLYPLPGREVPLAGAYLAHALRASAGAAASVRETARPYVYASFIASLDGRIAVANAAGRMTVPAAVVNERDWRLVQELTAQADLVISSGRYLRDRAAGSAQEILQVDDPRFADLRAWRTERGLPIQPDLAIVSGRLDFPIPAELTASGRRVYVITMEQPQNPERRAAIEAQLGPVLVAGERRVEGPRLADHLSKLGYRTIYSAAGPQVLHLLLSGGLLNRLYLTLANRILGGEPYTGVLEGARLSPPADFGLRFAYLDPHAPDGLGQLLLTYERFASGE